MPYGDIRPITACDPTPVSYTHLDVYKRQALGYSQESGIPYGIGFIKNKYIGRTFIQGSQKPVSYTHLRDRPDRQQAHPGCSECRPEGHPVRGREPAAARGLSLQDWS